MTREEAQIRSEGALQATEVALARITHILTSSDWMMQVRAQTVMPDRIDDAIDQVLRVDLVIGTELATRRNKVAELARSRLRELGVEPTATRLDDLVMQLAARARVAEPKPHAPPRIVVGLVLAIAFAGLMFAWRDQPGLIGVLAFIVLMLWAASRR